MICPEHGEMDITPREHLIGVGCIKCKEAKESNGEKEVRLLLRKSRIKFEPQHRFDDCRHINPLPFDFYIPKYNLCIEYDGRQHYEPIPYFGGEEAFEKNQLRDKIKNNYCKDNNIPLIRIRYDENVEEKVNEGLIKYNVIKP
jgi:very-short-patch-repair endonuclease